MKNRSWLVLLLVIGGAGLALAADIEIYAAGKKFTSVKSYEEEKKREELRASAKAAGAAMALSKAVTTEPLMGKTVILRPDGTTITSMNTLEKGKAVTVKPGKVKNAIEINRELRSNMREQGRKRPPARSYSIQ